MKIKYLGHSSFKITGKTEIGEEITIITDPFNPKEVGLPYPIQDANVVTVSHQHFDHNYLEVIKGKQGEDYFLVDTPGEFEIKGLRIYGFKTFHDDKQGTERGVNAIFTYDFAESRIAHLGDIGHNLDNETIENLENIDILMIPVGGTYTIDMKTAIEIIEEVEPQIVIPMHFKTPKHSQSFSELATLDAFISEIGVGIQDTDTFSLKSHVDLPENLTVIRFNS